MIRIGIVGVGRQGSGYLKYFKENRIKNAVLTGICDIDNERMQIVDPEQEWLHYADFETMFCDDVIDGVIIDTPHYLHPIVAAAAVKHNIHVLSDKPLGVDVKTIRLIEKELNDHDVTFGVLFNQRLNPLFRRIKEILELGELGKLKRCVWEITDWYRPQRYYDLGGWRSTWEGEGGGVLINQCVHNIDMLCYFFGKPKRIQSYIGYGDFHKTVVDDNVVANLFFDEGFVCTIISSTGETPGTNRLEISGTLGRLLFDEFGKIKLTQNDIPEDIFSRTAESPRYKIKFGKPKTTYKEELFANKIEVHSMCIQDFVDAIYEKRKPSADYYDGLLCAEVINGIYLSDWMQRSVAIPVDEELFYEKLRERWETK